MKICVSSYSFSALVREKVITSQAEIADYLVSIGADGLEIVFGELFEVPSVEEAVKIRKLFESKGLAIPSCCLGSDLLNNDLDTEIERIKRHVDFAAALGAEVMRHDAAWGYKGKKYGIGYQNALPRLADACRQITEYAMTKGVVTATENHGFFFQDSERVMALINAVNHENFGALVDIGNFLCADEEPPMAVGNLAPYARMVHAKDFFVKSGNATDPGAGWFRSRGGNYLRGAIIGHGDAKAAQSLGILKRAGYDGWISIEFEGMEDPRKGIAMGMDNVKRFWG